MHFSLVFSLWFFPTVKFVFITRAFLQRLAGLICCVFISFLLFLLLCLYFHFHFWDVGQDNRVGRAAGTGHKPVNVVQLFVVTISLRLRLRLCRCRPLARLGSWFLALSIFSSSDLFCLPFSPSSARLGSTGPLLAYALCYSCGLALVTCKFLLLPFVFAFVLFPVSNNQRILCPSPSFSQQPDKLSQTYVPPETDTIVVVVALVVCAGMWPELLHPSLISAGTRRCGFTRGPTIVGVKRIRMSEMDLWHIPK